MYYDNKYKPARLMCATTAAAAAASTSGGDYQQLAPAVENEKLNEYTVQGTYVHPYFVPFLMLWLDPALLIIVQRTICNLMKLDYNDSSDDDDDDSDDDEDNAVAVDI